MPLTNRPERESGALRILLSFWHLRIASPGWARAVRTCRGRFTTALPASLLPGAATVPNFLWNVVSSSHHERGNATPKHFLHMQGKAHHSSRINCLVLSPVCSSHFFWSTSIPSSSAIVLMAPQLLMLLLWKMMDDKFLPNILTIR